MKKPISNKILHKLFIDTGMQKVTAVLFRYPEKDFSLSDLASKAGVAKANIGKILDDLHKLDLIEITKLTKMWRIKANQQSLNFRKSKIMHNLNIIYQSDVVDLLNDHYNNPKVIILFGSFRTGEDISTSDIDIAIETENTNEYETVRLEQLTKFEKAINRHIQIHIFNRRNIDINVFNNIANGIVLSGFLEVRP